MGLNLEGKLFLISNVQALLSQVPFYIIASSSCGHPALRDMAPTPLFSSQLVLAAHLALFPLSLSVTLSLSLSLSRSTPAAAHQTSSLLVISPPLPFPSHPALCRRRPRLLCTASCSHFCPHQTLSLPRVGITLCVFQQHIGQDPRCSGHR